MEVYVEYVFTDNFVIDYLILKLTCLIAGKRVKTSRLLSCAFFGAVFAVLFPLIENPAISLPAKITFGLLTVTAAVKSDGFTDYLFTAGAFFGVTFLTGGAIIGAFSLLGLNYSSEYAIGLMILPVYIVLKTAAEIIKKFKAAKVTEKFSANVEITVNGVTVACRGFFDTGNSLYDGLSPVIVVDKNLAEKFFTDVKSLPRLKPVAVFTATGTAKKMSLKNVRVIIYYGGEKNIFNNVTAAIADLKNPSFDVLLHPDLMEVKNVGLKTSESVS
ncbi:MAG: sigma-E processing peptidase SpoIIGA [Clostridia bacterium]|nr:sigma-E processing peptidase SpoIIGA [Clostridia bacterium]